jgi:hypothetical protein
MDAPNYQEISHNTLSVELDVRRMGIDDGERQPSDSDINSSQQKIVQHCESILHDAADIATKFIKNCKNRRNDIESEHPVSSTEGLPEDAKLEIQRVMREQKVDLERSQKNASRQIVALRGFKARHKITAPAQYPVSLMFHWSIIAALILGEAIANAYFFAKGSDLGLLGGLLQASLISGANVGFALVVGRLFLPNLNLRIGILKEVRAKVFFWGSLFFVVIYLVACIAFNLMVAHFRDQLELTPFDPTSAAMAAVTSFMNAPFGISNVDSWLLFAVGILCAAIALFKGYRADDPYPNYGKLDRNFHQAERSFDAAEKKLVAAVNAKSAEFAIKVDTQIAKSNNLAKEYINIVETSKAHIADYQRYCTEVNSICRTLIEEYRAAYAEVRTHSPPNYFTSLSVPSISFSLDPDELERLADFRNFSKTISETAKRVADDMRVVGSNALESVNSFLENIKAQEIPEDMEE